MNNLLLPDLAAGRGGWGGSVGRDGAAIIGGAVIAGGAAMAGGGGGGGACALENMPVAASVSGPGAAAPFARSVFWPQVVQNSAWPSSFSPQFVQNIAMLPRSIPPDKAKKKTPARGVPGGQVRKD